MLIFFFNKLKHRKSWLVQIATGTKRKVSEVVEKCPLVMDVLVTCADLNVIALGSYDILIGMDLLKSTELSLTVTIILLNAWMKKEIQGL